MLINLSIIKETRGIFKGGGGLRDEFDLRDGTFHALES